jgi:hypothetical protein
MKRILRVIGLLVLPAVLSAGDLRHALGFFGGQISGSGFSYRQMRAGAGFQITFGLLSSKGDKDIEPPMAYTFEAPSQPPDLSMKNAFVRSGRDFRWNVGVNVYKTLHRSARTCFYCLTGAAVYGSRRPETVQDYGTAWISGNTYSYGPLGSPRKRVESERTANAGLGLGIEWAATENLRFSLEWPLTVSSDGDVTMIIPQGGLQYYFR